MRNKKTLFMETTEVPAERTAAEIIAVLVDSGATHVGTQYENGEINGLKWAMKINGREITFSMPARVEPVYWIFRQRKGYTKRADGFDKNGKPWDGPLYLKARRVAWRQLLRWVQAQAAMIDCGMTEAAEVFFPYIQAPSGQTLFEHFKEKELKALPAREVQ